ncbi:nucleotide exchange factor GrpE [candidate division KSB1 bacterium]
MAESTEPKETEQGTEISSEKKNGDISPKKDKKKRKSLLQHKINLLREEVDTLKDQLLRKMAEFENFRKRNERERSFLIKVASEDVIVTILPIIDDLERSLSQPQETANDKSFREGVGLIHNKMTKILESKGLKVMETDGKVFDPQLHEAMLQIENKEVPSNHIIETFEKGYYLNDKVIRHAKVSVSK